MQARTGGFSAMTGRAQRALMSALALLGLVAACLIAPALASASGEYDQRYNEARFSPGQALIFHGPLSVVGGGGIDSNGAAYTPFVDNTDGLWKVKKLNP